MKLNITIEGKTYEVDVEVAEQEAPKYLLGPRGAAAPAPSAGPKAGPSGSGAAASRQVADESKVCRSPLSGMVSQVKVAVGDSVTAEQEVIILEAMKMFTSITSPVEGKVVAIDVAVGDAVKQGSLLIEFE